METVWTEGLMQALTALWNEGLSTAEIGRRIGVSKNAVVGKAHRLSLTPRPSPLKTTSTRPRVKRSAKVVEIVGPTCSWPHGHPGDRDFHFCGARALPGKPYCSDHAAMAYIRPKKQGSHAA